MGLKDVVGGMLKVLSSSKKTTGGSSSGSSSGSSGTPSGTGPVIEGVRIEYTPTLDGDPDPGEVVWTWVPYEDDPSQGKDRPVVIIGRKGAHLGGVALTSKDHDRADSVEVGTGSWDSERRPSYAKLDRLIDVDPNTVRREGAVLDKSRFDALVAALAEYHGASFPR